MGLDILNMLYTRVFFTEFQKFAKILIYSKEFVEKLW